jgi:hypothetical protein
MTDGSRIIGVLEAAWADIRARHADVPEVVMITGSARTHKATELKLGHFGADRWADAATRKPELFIAGELFKPEGGVSGGRRVLCTLLHEASHGAAHARGIKDCSRQNRYHNKRFAAIAAELGLTPPTEPHSTLGFSSCTLGDETAAAWSSTIEAFDAAGLPHLETGVTIGGPAGGKDGEDGEGEGKGKSRSGARRSAVCGCNPPRKLSITPKQLEIGGIICAICMGEFEVEQDDQADEDED